MSHDAELYCERELLCLGVNLLLVICSCVRHDRALFHTLIKETQPQERAHFAALFHGAFVKDTLGFADFFDCDLISSFQLLSCLELCSAALISLGLCVNFK